MFKHVLKKSLVESNEAKLATGSALMEPKRFWQIIKSARIATPTVLIIPSSRRLLHGVSTIGQLAINTVADGAGCGLPPFPYAWRSVVNRAEAHAADLNAGGGSARASGWQAM